MLFINYQLLHATNYKSLTEEREALNTSTISKQNNSFTDDKIHSLNVSAVSHKNNDNIEKSINSMNVSIHSQKNKDEIEKRNEISGYNQTDQDQTDQDQTNQNRIYQNEDALLDIFKVHAHSLVLSRNSDQNLNEDANKENEIISISNSDQHNSDNSSKDLHSSYTVIGTNKRIPSEEKINSNHDCSRRNEEGQYFDEGEGKSNFKRKENKCVVNDQSTPKEEESHLNSDIQNNIDSICEEIIKGNLTDLENIPENIRTGIYNRIEEEKKELNSEINSENFQNNLEIFREKEEKIHSLLKEYQEIIDKTVNSSKDCRGETEDSKNKDSKIIEIQGEIRKILNEIEEIKKKINYSELEEKIERFKKFEEIELKIESETESENKKNRDVNLSSSIENFELFKASEELNTNKLEILNKIRNNILFIRNEGEIKEQIGNKLYSEFFFKLIQGDLRIFLKKENEEQKNHFQEMKDIDLSDYGGENDLEESNQQPEITDFNDLNDFYKSLDFVKILEKQEEKLTGKLKKLNSFLDQELLPECGILKELIDLKDLKNLSLDTKGKYIKNFKLFYEKNMAIIEKIDKNLSRSFPDYKPFEFFNNTFEEAYLKSIKESRENYIEIIQEVTTNYKNKIRIIKIEKKFQEMKIKIEDIFDILGDTSSVEIYKQPGNISINIFNENEALFNSLDNFNKEYNNFIISVNETDNKVINNYNFILSEDQTTMLINSIKSMQKYAEEILNQKIILDLKAKKKEEIYSALQDNIDLYKSNIIELNNIYNTISSLYNFGLRMKLFDGNFKGKMNEFKKEIISLKLSLEELSTIYNELKLKQENDLVQDLVGTEQNGNGQNLIETEQSGNSQELTSLDSNINKVNNLKQNNSSQNLARTEQNGNGQGLIETKQNGNSQELDSNIYQADGNRIVDFFGSIPKSIPESDLNNNNGKNSINSINQNNTKQSNKLLSSNFSFSPEYKSDQNLKNSSYNTFKRSNSEDSGKISESIIGNNALNESKNNIQNGVKNETGNNIGNNIGNNSVNNNTPKSEGLSNTKKIAAGTAGLTALGAGFTMFNKSLKEPKTPSDNVESGNPTGDSNNSSGGDGSGNPTGGNGSGDLPSGDTVA